MYIISIICFLFLLLRTSSTESFRRLLDFKGFLFNFSFSTSKLLRCSFSEDCQTYKRRDRVEGGGGVEGEGVKLESAGNDEKRNVFVSTRVRYGE